MLFAVLLLMWFSFMGALFFKATSPWGKKVLGGMAGLVTIIALFLAAAIWRASYEPAMDRMLREEGIHEGTGGYVERRHEAAGISGIITIFGFGALAYGIICFRSSQMPTASKIVSEQAGAGQPATRPVDEPEGGDQPQPEAEGRSR